MMMLPSPDEPFYGVCPLTSGGNLYPKVWDEVITTFSKNDKIMVIGGTDRGKSTFSLYASMKMDLPLLDADIGQATVPPPTVIKISSDRITIDAGFFVGSTTAVKNMLGHILGTYILSRRSRGMIIDTCGLVRGSEGFWLKFTKVLLVNPDVIIAMSRSGDLDHILSVVSEFFTGEIIDIGASPYARKRGFEERYMRRKMKFKLYFGEGKIVEIQSPKFFSFPSKWNIEKHVLAALTGSCAYKVALVGDTIYGICREYSSKLSRLKRVFNASRTVFLDEKQLKNTLVGLYSRGEFLGIGIVEETDFKEDTIRIYTSDRFDTSKEVTAIQLGYLKLTRDGDELKG